MITQSDTSLLYMVQYDVSLWFTRMYSLAIRKVKGAQGGLVLNSALHSTLRSKVSPSSNPLVGKAEVIPVFT